MSDERDTASGPQTSAERTPSLLRRYAGPVLLGIALGLALLYGLGRLADRGRTEPKDESTRMAVDPRLVIAVPELPDDAEGASGEDGEDREDGAEAARSGFTPAPPPCPGGVEDADCLVSTVTSGWQVVVGDDAPAAGGVPVVPSRIGERLRWPVLSARGGMVVSFLVEQDGSVLLLYPTPVGDLPVLRAGVLQEIPRPIDRGTLRWSEPGRRRVFALVTTSPLAPPFGQQVGRVATYYEGGDESARFFAFLRGRIHGDQATGAGEWALAEAIYDIEAAEPATTP